MSSIDTELNIIRTARYGKDNRKAIHDALLRCWSEGSGDAVGMMTGIYDTNGNGRVDDTEKLGGKAPSEMQLKKDMTLSSGIDPESKAFRPVYQQVILSAAGWSSSEPYQQTVTAAPCRTKDNTVFVLPAQGMTKAQFDALSKAQITVLSQAAGILTLAAYGTKPTTDIPIDVIGLG